MPPDLLNFYMANEGVGLGSSPDRSVRICRLNEVVRIGWRQLHLLGCEPCEQWDNFAAFRIGSSSFGDEIVYVLKAPVCTPGAVLTIGVDVAGPGGSGLAAIEACLVLAVTFPEWLRHLERMGWVEYGLVPGGILELPEPTQHELRRYYFSLNPGITWGET